MRLRNSKILLPLALTVVAAALAVSSLREPAPAPQVHTVRVFESTRSPYFLPQYLALNLGYFKEQHLEVQISTTSPEHIRAALADGRTDIALCGLQKIIFNPGAKGPQPRVFATMARRDGSLLLARKNSEAFSWQKLKDKTIIGGSQDDSSEIALEDALRQQGLPPYRKITVYNNIPDTLRIGAFRTGTGHYIQLLEPDAALAEQKGYGQVAASVGEAAGDMLSTAYAALPGYIEAKPDVLQGFTNAVYKAQLWMAQHSVAEAAAVAAPSFPNLDREVLLKAIERYQGLGVWTANPLVLRESYNRFLTAATDAGEITAPPAYETSVILVFAQQAVETVVYVPEEEPKKKSFFQRFK